MPRQTVRSIPLLCSQPIGANLSGDSSDNNRALWQIWQRVESLTSLRDQPFETPHKTNDDNCLSNPILPIEELIEQIDNAVTQLAWLAVDIKAEDQDEMDFKTRILKICIIEKDADLIASLAESLRIDTTRLNNRQHT